MLAVAGATVIGGATAAIPSSANGQIHGCYRNNANLGNSKGALRVVDSEASQTCTSQETALNWDAAGSSSQGYLTVKEDPSNVGQFILDPARSKGLVSTKAITCENAVDPTPLGCPIDNILATCFDLVFLPRYIEDPEELSGVAIIDTPELAATVEGIYCGPGYNVVQFGNPTALSFIFLK